MAFIPHSPKRPAPSLGLLLLVAIVLAVIAFGLFKRRGARKPPPLPNESSLPACPVPCPLFVSADGHGASV